jgi:hypothetical protein
MAKLEGSWIIRFWHEISGSHCARYEDDSSGMLRRVVSYKLNDFSEVLAACIIRDRSDDGGSKHL